MCGIAGSVNISLTKKDLKQIKHRGPDSEGIYQANVGANPVSLGHVRLSIVDLTDNGAQPMISECGNYVIIFNGEIYNHQELRKELKEINFKGHSDTETILYYLIKYGITGIKEFNGIFAFAFLDKKNNLLHLVRDPFGIKPLYYQKNGNQLIFSSELKIVLKKIGQTEIDQNHLYTYLRLRYNPSPQTLFKRIKKLQPGHYVTYNLKTSTLKNPVFYSYRPEKTFRGNEEDALEQYDYYLRSAIKRQLMADVPIAILLSGGVDSALLTQIAREVSGDNFATYTAGYKTKTDIDELEDAKISAELLGTNHHEVIMDDQSFIDHLSDFIEYIEEPLGSQSIMPLFFLSKRIHQDGYKVVLTGQGVDEPWGGYPKYNPQNLMEWLSNPLIPKSKVLHKLFKNDQARRAINGIMEKDRLDRFIEVCSVFDRSFLKNLMLDYNYEKGENTVKKLFKDQFELFQLSQFKPVDSLMFFDARMNLADDLLMYTDKISMKHSLETRVPFLDLELTKFVESLPSKYKVTLFENKKLHKKLAEKYLPNEIIYRKKKHFATPRKKWFEGEIGKDLEDKIKSDAGIFSDFFNKKYIYKLFNDHRRRVTNNEKQLYLVVSLFLWFQNMAYSHIYY